MTVRTRVLRELPVGAASAAVQVGRTLFVVADDENRLAAVNVDSWDVRFVGFEAGQAASDHAERKRRKRDIEALTVAEGWLIALGSGSTPNRCRGFAWAVDDGGDLSGGVRPLDLQPLYAELSKAIPDLNVEGATFAGGRLLLFQRGNGPGGVNAVVELEWRGEPSATLDPAAVVGIDEHELGWVEGVRLCFTDATCAGDDVFFTAVAEAALSTYEDGPCVGAAVGILGGPLLHLDPPLKAEGVEVAATGPEGVDLLLVVDDDDPRTPAQLVSARIVG